MAAAAGIGDLAFSPAKKLLCICLFHHRSRLWRKEKGWAKTQPPDPSGDQCQYIRGQRSKTVLLCSREVLGSILAAAIITDDVEGDLLTFHEVAHARPFNGRDMNEDVRRAIARLNEAEALGRIEELNDTIVHDDFLSIAFK
jgi:hypothetical protein